MTASTRGIGRFRISPQPGGDPNALCGVSAQYWQFLESDVPCSGVLTWEDGNLVAIAQLSSHFKKGQETDEGLLFSLSAADLRRGTTTVVAVALLWLEGGVAFVPSLCTTDDFALFGAECTPGSDGRTERMVSCGRT